MWLSAVPGSVLLAVAFPSVHAWLPTSLLYYIVRPFWRGEEGCIGDSVCQCLVDSVKQDPESGSVCSPPRAQHPPSTHPGPGTYLVGTRYKGTKKSEGISQKPPLLRLNLSKN